MTVFGDRKVLVLKELVEFLTSAEGRIEHQVLEEVDERLKRHVLSHELHDAINNEIVNRFILEVNLTVLDLDISADIIPYGAFNVNVLLERSPIAVLDVLLALAEVCVIGSDDLWRVSEENDGDGTVSDDDGRIVHGFLSYG